MQFKLAFLLQILPLLQLASAIPKHKRNTTTTTTAPSSSATGCAPGYYLPEITNFNLQLPYGESSSAPLTITGSKLAGCSGYQNSTWFYWDAQDQYIVMNAPPSDTDCAKTSGSEHCRTEFREENPASWSPSGTNTMTVQLAVIKADDGDYGTVIGQVFSADYSKPVAELYYAPSGVMNLGVEQTTAGGSSNFYNVGTVAEGTTFTYELSYSNDDLSISIDGGSPQSFASSQLGNPNAYFKVGNYNQGETLYSQVNIYSIDVVHQ